MPGDLVKTRDHGYQPVRWIGRATCLGSERFAPVTFAPGAFGNRRLLRVSPRHRMLGTGATAELWLGTSEILLPAIALVNGHTIRQQRAGLLTYVHLYFDRHEIIYAEGVPSESYFPGVQALAALPPSMRRAFEEEFPASRQQQLARTGASMVESRVVWHMSHLAPSSMSSRVNGLR